MIDLHISRKQRTAATRRIPAPAVKVDNYGDGPGSEALERLRAAYQRGFDVAQQIDAMINQQFRQAVDEIDAAYQSAEEMTQEDPDLYVDPSPIQNETYLLYADLIGG